MSTSLAEAAHRTDDAVTQARTEHIRAVRLPRFHGTTPLTRRLREHSNEIRRIIAAAGGSNVRVFGSAATGQDHDGSDIDLLFTMGTPLSLMQLGALEQRLSDTLGAPVDLVPDSVLRPEFSDRTLAEAVAL